MDSQETNKKIQCINRSLTKASSKKVQADIDSKNGGGIHVIAKENLCRGDHILSCNAVSIGLDPEYRHLCAYCVRRCTEDNNNLSKTYRCCKCHIISICSFCQTQGVKRWHEESGECLVLACLVRANFQVFEGDQDLTFLEKAKEVDSSILLTVRILFRRWSELILHDNNQQEKKMASPFPNVEWEVLDALYTCSSIGATSDEKLYYDHAINALCDVMISLLLENDNNDNDCAPSQNKWKSWMNKEELDSIMGSLGCQCLGRALFLEHSFYNHACSPNAYFSCHFDNQESGYAALTARIHCIHDTSKGESVTISYIPTSGLDCTERRKRLKDGYNFECQCDACERKWAWAKKIEDHVALPVGHEVDVLRNMQYECNQELLTLIDECKCSPEHLNERQRSDLQICLSTIQMNKRGIHNQNIPGSHEVSIESHRLNAAALSLSGDAESAVKEHEAFHKAVQNILRIFDPVAYATSLNEYAAALEKVGDCSRRDEIISLALDNVSCALGRDHIFRNSMMSTLKGRPEKVQKKQKHSNI
jgi:hypothetical protein